MGGFRSRSKRMNALGVLGFPRGQRAHVPVLLASYPRWVDLGDACKAHPRDKSMLAPSVQIDTVCM